MRPISAIRRSTIAVAAMAALALTGCSGTQEAARNAGDTVGDAAKTAVNTAGDAAKTAGDAAKTAATATGQAALAPAVNPVLDLLKKSEGEVKGGKLGEATAETDSDGRPLTGSCTYVLASTGPLPRWWSLGIIETADAKAALQTTADSDTAVHEADGSVKISAATAPQAGNWLKAPDKRRFTLIYSALSSSARALEPPFSITRGACS
jgi:hypothetical protein